MTAEQLGQDCRPDRSKACQATRGRVRLEGGNAARGAAELETSTSTHSCGRYTDSAVLQALVPVF